MPLQLALNFSSRANLAKLEVLLALLLFDLPLVVDEHNGPCTPQEHAGSWTLIMDHPKAKLEQVKFLVKSIFDKLEKEAPDDFAALMANFKSAREAFKKGTT